jgi:hypothetical protein
LQVEQPRVRQGEGSKVPGERPQEKEGVERLLGAGKVADRWPEERPAIERPREGIALPERRPPGKKPLSRVIKRTFVPVVRGVKIG